MIIAIVQARMGSSRLPGKVLKEICGQPMLKLQLERLRRASLIDRLLVATTESQSDQPIFELCRQMGLKCFRGSENDVLDRFYQAAREAGAGEGDAIVRLTADCPLADPEIVDRVIALYLDTGADYASNINPPTFPDGLDVEVFSYSSLGRAWSEAALASEREHVTPYIRNNEELFPSANLVNERDLSELRWTVDEAADLEMVRVVYNSLYFEKPGFVMQDVLDFLEKNPEAAEINRGFIRNEGYQRSLADD